MVEPLSESVKLNIGCGTKYWQGWINIDCSPTMLADVYCNGTTLPFKNNTVDEICAIHLFEHLYRWEVESTLCEWRRVLKDGGKLIMELPSLDKIFKYIYECVSKKVGIKESLVWWGLWGSPEGGEPLMTHKWGYSSMMVKELLQDYCFSDIKCIEPIYHSSFRDMRFECTK